MTTSDIQQFEHTAIEGLCAELTARGRPARVIGWPDLDPASSLTTDALAEMGDATAVIEHCRITSFNQFPPAHDEARKQLLPELEEIAKTSGHFLLLSVLPQTGTRQERMAYYASTLDFAKVSAAQGPGMYSLDAFTLISVQEKSDFDGLHCSISTFISDGGSAGLIGQVNRAMKEAWTKKLAKQLPPAKGAGHRVVLLLDMIPAPNQQVPSQFLASPESIATAIEPVLADHSGVVDELWIRRSDGEYQPLPPPIA